MQIFTFKRQIMAIFLMLLCVCATHADDNLITQQITIEVKEAGTLPNKIGSTKKYQITNLKLKGELNGTDLGLIREMCFANENGHLETLDLSEAKIVKGGDNYSYGCNTDNNVLGRSMFSDCSSLIKLELPVNITSVGFRAFYGCKSLSSLVIPSSVTEIDSYVFEDCLNLEDVTFPEGIQRIEAGTFLRCKALKHFTIPSTVNSIDRFAFCGCTNLEEIELPLGVTSIEAQTFDGCSNLKSVLIPTSVTSIEKYAFDSCEKLSSIDIPASVTSIGDKAFQYCNGLTSIFVHWNSPISTGSDVFKGCDKEKCTVYIPKGTYQDYWLSEFGYFDNLVEAETTGINMLPTSGKSKAASRYSANGQRLTAPTKGLNIVKYSDGSVRKEIVK